MSNPQLVLEIMSGPLDGKRITIMSPTDLGRGGSGKLSFPWDASLQDRHAQLRPEDHAWVIDPYAEQAGLHQVIAFERVLINGRTPLQPEMVLVAGVTVLKVVAASLASPER